MAMAFEILLRMKMKFDKLVFNSFYEINVIHQLNVVGKFIRKFSSNAY